MYDGVGHYTMICVNVKIFFSKKTRSQKYKWCVKIYVSALKKSALNFYQLNSYT